MTTFLQVLVALPSLIKTISDLMGMAEEAIGAGKGADKKTSVLAAIEAMVGNADLWGKIKDLFSGIVNVIALFKFGSTGKDPVVGGKNAS